MRVLSKRALIAAALGGLTVFAPYAQAGNPNTNWTGAVSNDWADASNWTGGVPNSNWGALGNGGTANISSIVPNIGDLTLGFNSNTGITVNLQTGGSLTVNAGGDADIGGKPPTGTQNSVLNIVGGSLITSAAAGATPAANVIIGDETGARGSIFISSGTISDAGKLRVGVQARASFNVIGSGGTINVAGNLTTRESNNGQSVSMSFALDSGGVSAIHVGGSTTIGGGGTGTALVVTMNNLTPEHDLILIDSASGSPLISGLFTSPTSPGVDLADGAAISTTFGGFWTYNWILDYDYGINDNDVALVFQSVVATPEPGTASFLLLGGIGASLHRRKHRRGV